MKPRPHPWWAIADLLILCGPIFAQTSPSFDVAVVKANKSGEPLADGGFLPGGRVAMENYTLRELVAKAWQVRKDQILGAPSWFDSDRFDITAKAGADTPIDGLRTMLKNLLAERFKLAVHEDQKVLPVFALIQSKHGATLQPALGSGEARCKGADGPPGVLHRQCSNMTMKDLAVWLPKMTQPGTFSLPVVDLTGITGTFDIRVDWAMQIRKTEDGRNTDATAGLAGPTIFDAVESLGLKLEERKLLAPVIVVDRVERVPSGN